MVEGNELTERLLDLKGLRGVVVGRAEVVIVVVLLAAESIVCIGGVMVVALELGEEELGGVVTDCFIGGVSITNGASRS